MTTLTNSQEIQGTQKCGRQLKYTSNKAEEIMNNIPDKDCYQLKREVNTATLEMK